MTEGQVRHAWFRPEDGAAFRDFFGVYTAEVRVADLLRALAEDDPVFRPVTEAIVAGWTPEVAARRAAALATAMQGDWGPYETDLRDEAVQYAHFGIRHWEQVTRTVTRIVTGKLVEKFATEPARLTSALEVMASFLSRVRETTAHAYREHKDRQVHAAELALERARAEQAVEARFREELRRTNAELESFSYSVAHDLRTPLRGMNGFARLLLDDHAASLDDEGKLFLRHICGSSVRMGEMIDALLELSRVTRSELQRVPTDLSAVALEVLEDLRAADPARAVDAVVEPGLVAEVDPPLARMLLANLLGNAWKFTTNSPAPRVELGRTDHGLFVRDNGAGFDMDHSDKLFVPFQRLHSAREFAGSGIGLATAHRILDRHGGRIWAEGKPGRGATFFLDLPGMHGDSE